MKFLRKNKAKKIVLVISDLHLGAGQTVHGRRNVLEDFHFDQELKEFLEYYSSGVYENLEVELVINGDFFDFLAVPGINFFDDEYWSESAALAKIKVIVNAHQEVMEAIGKFLENKNKKIIYLPGNHDAELIFPSVRAFVREQIPLSKREQFQFITENLEYSPIKGVLIKHGHDYESAHCYDLADSIVKSSSGENYFLAPWGSYYVTRIVNKYKLERSFINSVRPVRTFLIYGLIFDTLFTIRFIFSNAYYFFMVIVLSYFQQRERIPLLEIFRRIKLELEIFQDYEELTQEFFVKNPEIKALIVGHTHEPCFVTNADGTIFVNTGTWTKMFNLDFAKRQDGYKLTYAHITEFNKEKVMKGKNCDFEVELNIWQGNVVLPYFEFR